MGKFVYKHCIHQDQQGSRNKIGGMDNPWRFVYINKICEMFFGNCFVHSILNIFS